MLGIGLLLLVQSSNSKKLKLYQCQQPDGTVVTQDRRCEVTRLTQVKPKPKRTNAVKSSKVKKQASKQFLQQPTEKSTTHKKSSSFLTQNRQRSPYFNLGWDKFIPKNWYQRKIQSNQYHQLLLSQQPLAKNNDFKNGVKLLVYPKTHQSLRQDAFAKALTLYHQIREQHSKQLINSHFKAHERFKIFNIEYKTSHATKAFTEFYIDEANNDLFVLTILSPPGQWQQHQQLANLLNSRL